MSCSTHRILFLLDATRTISNLEPILERLSPRPEVIPMVLHRSCDGDLVRSKLRKEHAGITYAVEENEGIEPFLSLEATPRASALAYLPCGSQISDSLFFPLQLPPRPNALTPLVPQPPLSTLNYCDYPLDNPGWYAPLKIGFDLLRLHGQPSGCDLLTLFEVVHRSNYRVNWWSAAASTASCLIPEESTEKWITPSSRTLAVISHYKCEEWLGQSLHSLINQTRRPDHIVVIDDASGNPPREILASFPEVTLLSTPENIGPEQILHHIIKRTDFDAYLVQDADDWSAENRLELLLNEAHRTGAELIGTQELDFSTIDRSVKLRTFPLNVTFAMRNQLGYYLSHGSSLIARALAMRIGGFDARFKVSADYDFFYRACLVARVRNVPEFADYRRLRPGSMTHAADTGMLSRQRQAESVALYTRAQNELSLLRNGGLPDARAKKRRDVGPFLPLAGPPLAMTSD